ncbi:MAG TPA: energy transducer TonB, partial [Vicinamibacteria bacterium]|nr:energy transducer TonB [Vicinamibacteria bacterium]
APSEALRKSLAEVPEATATEPSAEVFALEVLRRALGAKAVPNRAWLARVESAAPLDLPPFGQRPRLNRLLTKEERRALSRRLMGETDGLEGMLPASERDDARLPAVAESPGEVRMISDLPPGFVGGILAASGCQPRKDEIAAAEVKFHADGRVQHVTLRTAPEGAGCREAVAALFVALAAPNERLPHTGKTDLVFARFDRDTLACLDEAPPESPQESPPRGTRRKITPPRKVRNVSPVYPEAARQSRTEGVVALEATIGTTGCIHSLRVLSGPPALALAAMAGVAQWRYSPALLDGRPVPVIMTVTVNFRGR